MPDGMDGRESALLERSLLIEVGAAADLATALDCLLDGLLTIPEIDGGGIYVADPETGNLVLRAWRGVSTAFVEALRVVAGDSPLGLLAAGGQAQFWGRGDVTAMGPVCVNEGFTSVASVPSVGDTGLVAVLNLISRSTDAFSEPTRTVVAALAATLAPVVARHRAEAAQHESARRHRRLVELLRAVTEAADELLDCPTTDEVYRRAVLLAAARLGLRRVGLYVRRHDAVQGTWSVDETGCLQDHRDRRLPLDDRWRRWLTPGGLSQPYETIELDDERCEAVAGSCITAAPLRAGQQVLGVLVCAASPAAQPADDAANEALAVFASLLGRVVERVQAEQAVVAAAARERTRALHLAAVLNAVPAAVLVAEGRDVRRVDGNPAAYELLGLPAGTDLSRPDDPTERPAFRARMDGRDLTRDELPIMRAAAEGVELRAFEEELVVEGGVRRQVVGNAVPLRDATGTITGAVAAFVDVTELRQLREEQARIEAQLREAARLQALGQLAGGVAHEFNNLLMTIQGYGAMVADSLPTDDPRQPDLRQIDAAATRAADLTRQLLAFGRRQDSRPRRLDLNQAVLAAHRLLQPLLPETVVLHLRLAAAPGTVLADPSQLEQVICNLVLNARDAMPEGGRIDLQTDSVRIDPGGPGDPGDYVLLRVRDHGVGMDEATLARVYEPFFTTKEVGEGTGLGLSTVYGIVQQCKGRIEGRSTLGEGSVFEVLLPAALGDQEAPEAEAAPAAGATILLVEDEEAVRRLTRRMLVRQGHHVYDAASGAEALDLADSLGDRLDLLISDVMMPGVQGPDLAARLRRTCPALRVLFMSGHPLDAVGGAAVARSDDYLPKPFSAHDLAAKVAQVLQRPC